MKPKNEIYELIYTAIDKSARQGASDEGSNERIVRNTALDLLIALDITYCKDCKHGTRTIPLPTHIDGYCHLSK